MSVVRGVIEERNEKGHKALSVFLTAGYPHPDTFVDLALEIEAAGADMLEIGIPFSDPIADGPVIQVASQSALQSGVNLEFVFNSVQRIRAQSNIPVILMGYANPILQYELKYFINKSKQTGVNGFIVPDLPLDEYRDFWFVEHQGLDLIMLVTPISKQERILRIDGESSGFVYCVSVTGITGHRDSFTDEEIDQLCAVYSQVTKNKMLIGFGISGAAEVRQVKSCCDGVIIGSAVIKKLQAGVADYGPAVELVRELRKACDE